MSNRLYIWLLECLIKLFLYFWLYWIYINFYLWECFILCNFFWLFHFFLRWLWWWGGGTTTTFNFKYSAFRYSFLSCLNLPAVFNLLIFYYLFSLFDLFLDWLFYLRSLLFIGNFVWGLINFRLFLFLNNFWLLNCWNKEKRTIDFTFHRV